MCQMHIMDLTTHLTGFLAVHLQVSPEGEVTQFLLGTRLTHLSDVEEEQRPGGGSRIWFGSIRNHYIAYLDV